MKRQKVLETNIAISSILIIFSLIYDINILISFSLGVLMMTIFLPRPAEVLAINWMRPISFIGHLVSTVVLSGIFYFALTPLAQISKFFRTDPLNLKKPKRTSYYYDVNDQGVGTDFKKMW